MGYKLCIAEKPSTGKEIARVVGAKNRHKGYYEGNGYLVTWAIGHLVSLAEPEAYGYVRKEDCFGEGKKTAYAELPLLPDTFKYVVPKDKLEQFNIVKRLMHKKDVDVLIDCGDMGAEGHILQWLIRTQADCKLPVMRFCATSMTDEAIRYAMNNLQPAARYENIIKGELCKKKADWILGMSMSRVLSIKYSAGINVGRVQSPTLFFVVKRFLEVQNFKVIDYFTMTAVLNEGFTATWNKDDDNLFPVTRKDKEGRVVDKSLIEKACCDLHSIGEGVISDLTKQKKAIERPQLYDITELQRQANVFYGYPAATTLATAQSLYETHKLLSYPRTDSRYITTDLSLYLKPFVEALSAVERYKEIADNLLYEGLNIDKRIVDDSKVTDHHALLPTNNICKYSGKELVPTDDDIKKGVTADHLNNILNLVLYRLLVALSKPHVYEHTNIQVKFNNGFVFGAAYNKPLVIGWRGCQDILLGKNTFNSNGTYESDEIQVIPDLEKGQTVILKDCTVVPKKTTAPKLHTEATLLTAMENAGAMLDNGKILKGKGIGTPATRAEIIRKLFQTSVIESVKSDQAVYLRPTPKGVSVIRVMPPDLYSPQITATWETMIAEIAAGNKTEHDFMNMFVSAIKDKINEVKTTDTGVLFKKEREVHGICPWCESELYQYDKKNSKNKVIEVSMWCAEKCGFYVSNQMSTFHTYLHRSLTVTELKHLITKGFIILELEPYKNYPARRGMFTLFKKEIDTKVYTYVRCETPKNIEV